MMIFFNIQFLIDFFLACFAKNARSSDTEINVFRNAFSLIKKAVLKYRTPHFLLLALFFSTLAPAEIYKTIDSSGKQHFSDIPTVGSISVHLKPANIYSFSPVTKSSAEDNNQNKQNKKLYQNFLLTQPTDQQTFQNQSAILVAVQIDPALQVGDSIEWLLDGKRYQQSTSTTMTLRELVRGEHTVQAKVQNLTTQLVTFYVHQTTIDK